MLTDPYDRNYLSFITIQVSERLKNQFAIQRVRIMWKDVKLGIIQDFFSTCAIRTDSITYLSKSIFVSNRSSDS